MDQETQQRKSGKVPTGPRRRGGFAQVCVGSPLDFILASDKRYVVICHTYFFLSTLSRGHLLRSRLLFARILPPGSHHNSLLRQTNMAWMSRATKCCTFNRRGCIPRTATEAGRRANTLVSPHHTQCAQNIKYSCVMHYHRGNDIPRLS